MLSRIIKVCRGRGKNENTQQPPIQQQKAEERLKSQESHEEWRELELSDLKIVGGSINNLTEDQKDEVMKGMRYHHTKNHYDSLKERICGLIMCSRHPNLPSYRRPLKVYTEQQKAKYWEINSKFEKVYPCSHEKGKEPLEKHYEERLNELLSSRRVSPEDRLNEAYEVLMGSRLEEALEIQRENEQPSTKEIASC